MSATTHPVPGTFSGASVRETSIVQTVPPRAGISWASAFAGATVAAAVSFTLIALGSGLGLIWVSPLSYRNPSVTTFTVVGAIWLIVVQWIAAFFGGYLAGRLRPTYTDIHTDEVGFRDTATGFVAWSVATLFVVAVAAFGANGLVSRVTNAASSVAASVNGGAATGVAGTISGAGAATGDYLVDLMFRPAQPNGQEPDVEAKAEARRILATGVRGNISQPDHDYLVQLVASHTSLSPADATKRVDDVIARERQAISEAEQAANSARKAAASFSIYSGLSMLIGAFIACVAAAVGGRQRDAL
jgi:hypothetical protein